MNITHQDHSESEAWRTSLLSRAVKLGSTTVVAAALMAGIASNAMAEMELGKVGISGYLDMSISSTDVDGGGDSDSAGLDRAEVRFKSQIDEKLSIEAHVAGGADEDYDLEQAHMVYQATESTSVIAGKYLSALGFEAYHAPDLYQYSISAGLVYPSFFNGVGVKYVGEGFEVYGSAASGIWDTTDTNTDEMGYEANVRFTAVENLTVFLGVASGSPTDDPAADFDQTLVNFWASYSTGPLTVAAEYNDLSDWGAEGVDGSSFLVMGNYMFNDSFGITVRTSGIDVDAGGGTNALGCYDCDKWTIAGSYIISPNLSLVAEYNTLSDNATDVDADTMALEMIVTF